MFAQHYDTNTLFIQADHNTDGQLTKVRLELDRIFKDRLYFQVPPMSADVIGIDFKFGQEENNGDSHISGILFFNHIFVGDKMDMLYLFDIANSHEHVGEQARGSYRELAISLTGAQL